MSILGKVSLEAEAENQVITYCRENETQLSYKAVISLVKDLKISEGEVEFSLSRLEETAAMAGSAQAGSWCQPWVKGLGRNCEEERQSLPGFGTSKEGLACDETGMSNCNENSCVARAFP